MLDEEDDARDEDSVLEEVEEEKKVEEEPVEEEVAKEVEELMKSSPERKEKDTKPAFTFRGDTNSLPAATTTSSSSAPSNRKNQKCQKSNLHQLSRSPHPPPPPRKKTTIPPSDSAYPQHPQRLNPYNPSPILPSPPSAKNSSVIPPPLRHKPRPKDKNHNDGSTGVLCQQNELRMRGEKPASPAKRRRRSSWPLTTAKKVKDTTEVKESTAEESSPKHTRSGTVF